MKFLTDPVYYTCHWLWLLDALVDVLPLVLPSPTVYSLSFNDIKNCQQNRWRKKLCFPTLQKMICLISTAFVWVYYLSSETSFSEFINLFYWISFLVRSLWETEGHFLWEISVSFIPRWQVGGMGSRTVKQGRTWESDGRTKDEVGQRTVTLWHAFFPPSTTWGFLFFSFNLGKNDWFLNEV